MFLLGLSAGVTIATHSNWSGCGVWVRGGGIWRHTRDLPVCLQLVSPRSGLAGGTKRDTYGQLSSAEQGPGQPETVLRSSLLQPSQSGRQVLPTTCAHTSQNCDSFTTFLEGGELGRSEGHQYVTVNTDNSFDKVIKI